MLLMTWTPYSVSPTQTKMPMNPNQPTATGAAKPRPKKQKFSFMATAEDLDDLRSIFEEMACDSDSEGQRIAKKMMRAIHACRKKHGFRWVNLIP